MRTIKTALYSAFAAMVLTGCGGDSSVSNPAEPGFNLDQPALDFEPGTYAVFNPANSELPTNNDFLFLSAASELGDDYDGTADVGSPTNPAEDAINDLDGFSTTAYFDIKFEGGSIDETTVCAFSLTPPGCIPNVFVLPLNTSLGDGDALNPENINPADAFDSANLPTKFRAFSATVKSLDGGTDNVLRITPQQPLLSATKYLVFVTDGVEDSNGDPVTPSYQYNLVSEGAINEGGSLQPVQDLVTILEQLAFGFLAGAPGGAIPADDIAISYTFTTTDPTAPLVAMAEPRAALLQAGVAPGNLGLFDLSTPTARSLDIRQQTRVDIGNLSDSLDADVGEIFTGYIELPQYLTAPATQGGTDFTYLNQFWRGDQAIATNLGAGGTDVPTDTDGTLNVTYRYPFAGETSVENFPLQVTMPVLWDESDDPTACRNLQVSEDGLPVVIYVHGITSDRTSVAALAHSLASACVATVAIDLPVHGVPANASPALVSLLNVDRGTAIPFDTLYDPVDIRERHFEVVQDAAGNPTVMNFDTPDEDIDGSGAWFINLANLQNTRDNLRQSVMDLLNLNASLDAISKKNLDGDSDPDTPLFNLGEVKLVGVSLGGIVGTVFGMVNEQAIANAGAVPLPTELNPLQGIAVSSAGSQMTQILNNSPTFAPRIQAGLAANGINVGTSDYESFLYVAQSTVASGDPVNFAEELAGQGVPVVVQQIVGGGDASALGDTKTYTEDKVVPNGATAEHPLMGTTALANLLGASQVASAPGSVDVSAGNARVDITVGHHASLLRPNEEDGATPTTGENIATAELQTEVVSFVNDVTQMAVGTAPEGSNTAAQFIATP